MCREFLVGYELYFSRFLPFASYRENAGFSGSLIVGYLSHIWSASVRGELFFTHGSDVGVFLGVFSLIFGSV